MEQGPEGWRAHVSARGLLLFLLEERGGAGQGTLLFFKWEKVLKMRWRS